MGFYQIRREHVEQLQVLNDFLTDARSLPCTITSEIRRRVVIPIETERPACLQDANRFRQTKAPAISSEPAVVVFQWWRGDPWQRVGHWESYPPQVCLQLEKELAANEGFKNCEVPVSIDGDKYSPIDGVRYSLMRISRERPFDFVEQSNVTGFPEPFLPSDVLTLDDGLFNDMDRTTGNFFVQFRNGNPKHRRPVRRVRGGETAGLDFSGEPRNVCCSDTGRLTTTPALVQEPPCPAEPYAHQRQAPGVIAPTGSGRRRQEVGCCCRSIQ